jgi:hypothetical protein
MKDTKARRRLREIVAQSSQSAVAKQIGAPPPRVSCWVRGIDRPTGPYRESLHREFGIDPKDWWTKEEHERATRGAGVEADGDAA